MLNLITSCEDCNRGKSDKRLSDDLAINKQKKQLEELQKRREQLDMMFQWQKSLLGLQDETVERLAAFWTELTENQVVSESGKKILKKLLGKFPIGEIMEAMNKAVDQYCDGTQERYSYAFNKIGGICRWKDMDQETKDVFYIRAILRNRGLYLNEGYCVSLLKKAIEHNVDVESLKNHAKTVKNWTAWRESIEQYIADNPINNDEREVADA